VLVAGDFNATTINYPCVKMNQYLDDAFERAGSGFGFTFSSPARRLGMITPFMRIDPLLFRRFIEQIYGEDGLCRRLWFDHAQH